MLYCLYGKYLQKPMAEAFKDLLKKRGSRASRRVQQAWQPCLAESHSRGTCHGNGISLTNHQTRQVDDELLKQADLILTMTEQHKSTIQASVPSVWDKIHTLKGICGDGG